MKTEIIKVNKASIECPYENEKHYVAIRSICQALGIDHQKQFDRIKNDEILSLVYTDTVYTTNSRGSKVPMFCLPLKYVFGWLFSIDESKVNAKAKDNFLKYKMECYDALYEHFYMRGALYEKRDTLILEKQSQLSEKSQAIKSLNEDLKRIKAEIVVIQSTPINQLKFDF